MNESPIAPDVALRIALATRALPGVSVGEMLEALQDSVGEVLNEESLSRITVTHLKTAFGQTYDLDGEEDGEDANANDIAAFKQAVRILWGQEGQTQPLPELVPYQDGEMPGSIRVAIAANGYDQLDGHFGSCLHYLVYQLSTTEMRLIDIRSTLEAELSDDRNAFRANLIKDCHVLYLVSVGGPAAAKVIRAGIYPIKLPDGGLITTILQDLQQVMVKSPPPWLAKILGVAAGDRVKNYKALV